MCIYPELAIFGRFGYLNVQNLLYESDRRISVEWARMVEENSGRKMTYPVKLTVFCDDRAGKVSVDAAGRLEDPVICGL